MLHSSSPTERTALCTVVHFVSSAMFRSAADRLAATTASTSPISMDLRKASSD